MDGKPAPRLFALDYLRAYCILLVVMAHGACPALYQFPTVSRSSWWTANVIDSLARSSVPLFLMITGYLLLDPARPDLSVRAFFKRRLPKLLIPYLFWSAFYLAWRKYYHLEALDINLVGKLFVAGSTYYHLYYLSIVLGLYLITPMAHVFVKYGRTDTKIYVLVVWFVLISLHPLSERYTGYTLNMWLQVTPLYFGFYLFGGLYRDFAAKLQPKHYSWMLIGIALTVLVTAYLTYYYTKLGRGELHEYYYNANTPNVVLMSMCSFPLLIALFSHKGFERLPLLPPLLRQVGACSFGIYLVHAALLEVLRLGTFGFTLSPTTFHPILAIPLIGIVIVGGCTLVLSVVQRIPYVRAVVV